MSLIVARAYCAAHGRVCHFLNFKEPLIAIIFHIAQREDWEGAEATGIYQTKTLPTEGFIHCSSGDQVIEVANLRFRGQSGLVLLVIDTKRVRPKIIYENLEGGQQLFPHIYGELNTRAVVQVVAFEPGADGYFELLLAGIDSSFV